MKIKYVTHIFLFIFFGALPYLLRNHIYFLNFQEHFVWFQLSIVYILTYIGIYQETVNDISGILWFALFGWLVLFFGPLGMVKYTTITLFYLFYSTITALLTTIIIQKLIEKGTIK